VYFSRETTSELSIHERVAGRTALTTGPLNTCPSIKVSSKLFKGLLSGKDLGPLFSAADERQSHEH